MKGEDYLILGAAGLVGYKIFSEKFNDLINTPNNWLANFAQRLNETASNINNQVSNTAQTWVYGENYMNSEGLPTNAIALNYYISNILPNIPAGGILGINAEQLNYNAQRALLGSTINRWDWGANVVEW